METLNKEEKEIITSILNEELQRCEFSLKLGVKAKSKNSTKLIQLSSYEKKQLELKVSSLKKHIKNI